MKHLPFKKVAFRRKGLLDEKLFFNEIAAEAGYIDVETVGRIYSAMVRVVSRRMKKDCFCHLPLLGQFYLQETKTNKVVRSGPRYIWTTGWLSIRFYLEPKWKQYLSRSFYKDKDS